MQRFEMAISVIIQVSLDMGGMLVYHATRKKDHPLTTDF